MTGIRVLTIRIMLGIFTRHLLHEIQTVTVVREKMRQRLGLGLEHHRDRILPLFPLLGIDDILMPDAPDPCLVAVTDHVPRTTATATLVVDFRH
ncbi:hypothetical protein AGR2A_Cc70087 [Agrobacterium genomosp. 2 str. CFBP 5494]|uniref:Uncharacterized protein n=1 Tax=Agrobacterium genomosp. 2 str. CFBP 5494 TaxID=1183436 RepID=A0A9W5F384_9HYPH|nr:hypothetical protein AGR2A_Cc70087 [Agrobacterium genomosp. 2 str. CFBP 5494]